MARCVMMLKQISTWLSQRVGRGVLHVETRTGCEPSTHRRVLVGGVVVDDQMHVELYLGAERENRPGEAGVLRADVPSIGPLSRLCSNLLIRRTH